MRNPSLLPPSITALLAAALLAVGASAQNVRAFGKVVRQNGAFALECGGLALRSTAVDLGRLEGEIAELTGSLMPGSPPVLEVATGQRAASRLEVRGDSRIGGELRLRVDSPIGRTYYLLASTAPGLVPLDGVVPLASGTFFLDPTRAFVFFAGELRGSWEEARPIPEEPALVGLELWLQAAVLPQQPPFVYLNCGRVQVRAD